MLVVCSGVKSILDVPATLEPLETRGVPVVGYRTDELPGVHDPIERPPPGDPGRSPAEAAALVRRTGRWASPARSSWRSRSPRPTRSTATTMEAALADATGRGPPRGVAGKAAHPVPPRPDPRGTGGRSLRANRALIVANARLAGEVARRAGPRRAVTTATSSSSRRSGVSNRKVLIIASTRLAEAGRGLAERPGLDEEGFVAARQHEIVVGVDPAGCPGYSARSASRRPRSGRPSGSRGPSRPRGASRRAPGHADLVLDPLRVQVLAVELGVAVVGVGLRIAGLGEDARTRPRRARRASVHTAGRRRPRSGAAIGRRSWGCWKWNRPWGST